MTRLLLIGILCMMVPNLQAQSTQPVQGTEFRLWDGPAPGVPENAPPEIPGEGGRIKQVSIPTLTVYLPDPKLANGSAIVMCSGGGYVQLNLPKYAKLGVDSFLSQGFVVFNFKYRLTLPSKNPRLDAVTDAKRAVRLIRSRAKEWNIHPNRIGLLGASAGANMILNLACEADDGNPDSPDPIERHSARPNFACLLSTWPSTQKISDFKLSKSTPIYLLHAEDDATAKVDFARQIESAAKDANVPVHAVYVEKGGHDAFGDLSKPTVLGDWTKPFLTWLEQQGLLKRVSN